MPFPFEYIPFPNKNVEEKVNYFFAYLELYNSKLGLTSDFEFETFYSLLGKIQYQLENNKTNHWKTYVLNHLRNKLFDHLDFLIEIDKKYATLKNEIIEVMMPLDDKEAKKWLDENKEKLRTIVDNSIIELPQNQHSIIIKILNVFLLSDAPLESYQKLLEVTCQLLVSDFRYCGYSKDDLIKYFEDTLNRENVWRKTENIINFSTFLQELTPFGKRKFKFWFKIANLELTEGFDFQFTYNKVIFVTLDYLKNLNLFTINDDFFKNADSRNIFAEIEISNFSKENSVRRAKYEIKNELTYINHTLNSSAYLFEDEYLIHDGISTWIYFENKQKKDVKEDDLNSLKNTNLFLQLKDIPNSIFEFERNYITAAYYQNLNGLWEYLENVNKQTDNNSKDEDYFVEKIIQNHAEFIQNRFRINFLHYTLWNYNGCQTLGISFEEQIRFNREWSNTVIDEYKKFDLPIIKKLISLSNQCNFETFVPKEKKYFSGLIKELKEYRNQYTHTGHVEPNLEIKLNTLMYHLFEKFRCRIFWELKTTHNQNHVNP